MPIACLTAYDASFSQLVDLAGVDLILVGDSLGMVIQGHETTVPVTVDDVVYHTRSVARGVGRAFLVADLPFMSYASPTQALDNAVRLMQEGGAMMVKLEGGQGQIDVVSHVWRDMTFPVCAHVGSETPVGAQDRWVSSVQGREPSAGATDGRGRQGPGRAPGADILLLECVPNEVGELVSDAIRSTGHRHRRRAGGARPNPGSVRHARYHAGADTALS